MLWFIIAAIVAVSVIIYWIRDDVFDAGELWGLGFMLFFAVIAIALIVALLSSAIAEECADKTYSVAEDIDIHALQDNITTEGSFFLGSGHINDELKYFYVAETDLGYTVKNVDADQSYIQYTDGRCHIEKQVYTFNNWFVRLIAIPITDRYIIYIPEGSIINNYSVDLK